MATVFVVAVLVPTLVLAWLAIRSLRDQEMIANAQRAVLHQSSAEALAADVNTFMIDVRVFYRQLLDKLILEKGSDELSMTFDRIAPMRWSQCSAASVVTDDGEILCPNLENGNAFIRENAPFFLNQADAKFYEAKTLSDVGPVITRNRLEPAREVPASPSADAVGEVEVARVASKETKKKAATEAYQFKVEVAEEKLRSSNPFRRMAQSNQSADLVPQTTLSSRGLNLHQNVPAQAPHYRNVMPSQSVVNQVPLATSAPRAVSQLEWGVGNLETLTEGKTEGAVSRFLQDGLEVMLWRRHDSAPGRIFWVRLNLESIRADLEKIVAGYASNNEICLALLDDEGEVVSLSRNAFETDWSQPFVASEVGQILPHWEVGAYLLDPEVVNRSARTARLMIWLLVPTLLGAIALGTLLIFRSVGLEMRLARQKTDFVSNVSHELRTPLTSIRMFSDLLTSNAASEKDREYSSIISREAARLTRLINDLLDFSRLERSDHRYAEEPIDVAGLTSELVETYRMQLESDGCRLVYETKPRDGDPVMVRGDRDALAQVLLNLLSNAEKYGCPEGDIEVRLVRGPGGDVAEWQVLDQGAGIDRKHAAKIFDKFYRVDDSLTNPVQGSGLGLTLAKRIVNLHGGEICYRNRDGGGSCFYVRLPLSEESGPRDE